MREPTIPVTLVTGFLGAGKSTLVRHWLGELPRDETAVIVNERGEVGIDGELLAAHVARLREVTGGCACCQSQAELISALSELSDTEPRPLRILVETSGAASPAGVIRALGARGHRDRLRLDGVITVVDIMRLEQALRFDLAVEQLAFADVVVLSHLDEAEASTAAAVLEAASTLVERHAPAAVLAEARGGIPNAKLIDLLALRAETLHIHPAGSAHRAIEAVSLVHTGELDEARFGEWVEGALGSVQARILRLKGILAMRGVPARVILQGVGEHVDIQLGTAWGQGERSSRLVVLGLGLCPTTLEAGFLRCASQPTDP